MNNLILKKAIIAVLAVLLVILPASACAPEASSPVPPQPPVPPAGTLHVEPAKIDFGTVTQMFNMIVTMRKMTPETAAGLPPCMGILALPITFSGTGWPANEFITIELVLPEGVTMDGLMPGENSIGIAFATAESSGNFEAIMSPVAKLNWLLRTAWTPMMMPDLTKANPLPRGIYTIKATGLDPGTVTTITWELELLPQK